MSEEALVSAAVEAVARLATTVPQVLEMLKEQDRAKVEARMRAASAALPAPGATAAAVEEVIAQHEERVTSKHRAPPGAFDDTER